MRLRQGMSRSEDEAFNRTCKPVAVTVCACLLMAGCRAEMRSNPDKVTHGTHLVLLESGIHWAEWIKTDGTPCGDVYKWNDVWVSDTYHEGLEQHPFDTKDEAISYVQQWCK